MTGEEDSEVLSLNLSSTPNKNSNFNNQNPAASSSGLRKDIQDQQLKHTEGGEVNRKDVHLLSSSFGLIPVVVPVNPVVNTEDDDNDFGGVDDFDDDDDDDAMQIVDSQSELEDLQQKHSLLTNFSGESQGDSHGELNISHSSTIKNSNVIVNVDNVISTITCNNNLNSTSVSTNSTVGVVGCGRTSGQSHSQLLSDDPDRLILSDEELAVSSQEQLIQVYHQFQNYIDSINIKHREEINHLKESEEKLRLQQLESSRRENVLVMRLTTKEQEMQEYAAQLNELKASIAPTGGALRSTLLDPAVNLIIQRMKKELDETKKKLEDTQNDLNAWKFTPDSNTGKRLMAKCRMLYQENEELGKMISSGRLAKLESDLALQKSLSDEMKKSQSEMDELVQELDEDVEGMQSTIYFLQQQLRDSKLSSNPILNSSNSASNSDVLNVNMAELCAQCRAIQEKKDQQQQHQQPSQTLSNSNSSLSSSKVKLEKGSPESLSSSSDIQNEHDIELRTCVNGEAETEAEPVMSPPPTISKNTKVHHVIMSKQSNSKLNFDNDDNNVHDDAESTTCSVANFVQKNQCANIKIEKIEPNHQKPKQTKKQKQKRGLAIDPPVATKRTRRSQPSLLLQNDKAIENSTSMNSNVVNNSSSSSSTNNATGGTVPSSSSFNSLTANGNGSLEH